MIFYKNVQNLIYIFQKYKQNIKNPIISANESWLKLKFKNHKLFGIYLPKSIVINETIKGVIKPYVKLYKLKFISLFI